MAGLDFHLEIYAHGDRTAAMEKCRTVLQEQGIDVLDHKMFSDLMLNYFLEGTPDRIKALPKIFQELHWHVDLAYDPRKNDPHISLVKGSATIYFNEGKGDKKDVIPAYG